MSKQSSVPSFLSNNQTKCAFFFLVHSDVWGPAPVASKSGARYVVTFIDDFTDFFFEMEI